MPHLSPHPRQGWDNLASLYVLSSPSSNPSLSPQPPELEPHIDPSLLAAPSSIPPSSSTNLTLAQAHKDPSSCSAACLSLHGCRSWRHEILREKIEEDGKVLAEVRSCALDSSVRLGREMDPLLVWERRREIVSGWEMGRIEERLVGDRCDSVGKVVLW
jgi:hypothetical protein